MKERYDYLKAMKEDIKEYIENEIILDGFEDREALEQALNDSLWTEDSVTGNASGSYTFSREKAKEYVVDNMETLINALDEFYVPYKEIGEKFKCENWEYFDITIRCYLLSQAISKVLDEMEV